MALRIIAVENTADDADALREKIRIAFPDSDCECFLDPFLAIKSYRTLSADFAVFCRHMRIIDGFTFARTLRGLQADFTGVMLALDDGGRLDAEKYFLGYLIKPYEASDLKLQYERIRQLRQA